MLFITTFLTGTYPNCQICGQCYDNVGKDLDAVGFALEAAYNTTKTIWTNEFRMYETVCRKCILVINMVDIISKHAYVSKLLIEF